MRMCEVPTRIGTPVSSSGCTILNLLCNKAIQETKQRNEVRLTKRMLKNAKIAFILWPFEIRIYIYVYLNLITDDVADCIVKLSFLRIISSFVIFGYPLPPL